MFHPPRPPQMIDIVKLVNRETLIESIKKTYTTNLEILDVNDGLTIIRSDHTGMVYGVVTEFPHNETAYKMYIYAN